MSWRVFTYGKWKTSPSHRWPSLSAVNVCEDNPPFQVIQRWYQFSWFGMTLNLDVPSSSMKRGWFIETRKIAEWFCSIFS